MRARTLAMFALGFLTLLPRPAAAQARSISPAQADGMRLTAVRTLGTEIDAPRRLEHMLGLEKGKRFDAKRTERSRRRLLQAGWLQKLDVLPAVTSPESLLVVVIAEPSPRLQVNPILQMRADERFVYGGKLSVWGQGGRGERFFLSVAGGGETLLQLEWSEPRPFLALPLAARFHAGISQETEAAEQSIRFERSIVDATFAIPEHGLRLELAGALWHVRASDPAASFGTDGVDRLRRGAVALAIGEPAHGFAWSSFHARAAVSATSGDAEHQDVDVRLGATTHLGNRLVVATGLAWRSVRGVVPRSERLHLGRGPALRGHDYGVANGDAGTWGGLELRVPLNFWSSGSFARVPLPVALSLFGDAGTAWGASAPGAQTEAFRLEDSRLRWSSGIGLTAFVGHADPWVFELGRDDGGTWRALFRTSLAF